MQKRPQQRSYPYINGLYLLLRTTELVRVDRTGKKARLVPNGEVMASWRGLNPTERYFTLLEAWLVHARQGTIALPGRREGAIFLDFSSVWFSVRDRGLKVQPNNEYSFSGDNGYQSALMDLFGLLEVEHGRPREGKPWAPLRVKRRPFGDAVAEFLSDFQWHEFVGDTEDGEEGPDDEAWDEEDDWEDEDEEEKVEGQPDGEEDGEDGLSEEGSQPSGGRDLVTVFGRLQPVFQPFFPEWRNNLVIPPPELRDGVYVFKVTLGNAQRWIAAPALSDLDQLADTILLSVDFDDEHLWYFELTDRRGAPVQADGPRFAARYSPDSNSLDSPLGELPLVCGEEITFFYDYGDSWHFDMVLERIDPPDASLTKPKLLEAKGKAPLQYGDWGGGDWEEGGGEEEDDEAELGDCRGGG